MKRFLSIVLALVIFLSSLYGLSVFSNAINYTNITSLNTAYTASISSAGQIKYYKYTPSVSGDYTFYSTGSYDTYGYVYDSNLSQLASDDDGGSSSNFSVTYYLYSGRTYYFGAKLYNSSSTGSFSVYLYSSSASISYTTISYLDTAYTASISTAGETKYFKYVPSTTTTYSFYSTGDYDTYGYIYDSSLTQLASDDDSGSERNFSVTYTLSAGTTYYFGAKLYSSSSTGTFYVYLTKQTCNHNYVFDSVTRKATKSSNGSYTQKCTYCGNTRSVTIYRPTSVTLSASSYTYKGSAIKPKPTVKNSNGAKISTSQYKVTYGKNKNAGKGTVKVTFSSTYYDSSCTITKTFKIKPKAIKKCGMASVYTYNGKSIVPKPYYYKTVKEWDSYYYEYYTYKKKVYYKKNTDYTIKISGGHKQVGKYTATIKFKGNYKGTVKKTFQIRPKPVTKSKAVAYSTTSVKFSWNKVKNVSGYSIYRYNYQKGKWVHYANTTKRSLIIPRSNKKDTDVWIKIFTYKKVGGKKYYNDGAKTHYQWQYTKPNKPGVTVKNKDFGEFNIYFNRSANHQVQISDNKKFSNSGTHFCKTVTYYGDYIHCYNWSSSKRYYIRAREYYYSKSNNLVVGPWSKVKSIVTW